MSSSFEFMAQHAQAGSSVFVIKVWDAVNPSLSNSLTIDKEKSRQKNIRYRLTLTCYIPVDDRVSLMTAYSLPAFILRPGLGAAQRVHRRTPSY